MKACGKSDVRRVEGLYEEGRSLLLRGRLAEAIRVFTSIYERDALFRDVAEIVQDYHTIDRKAWLAKYRARLGDRV